MGAPVYQPRPLAAKSCSSLSAKSDDSDFEFGSCSSQEAPASPRLQLYPFPAWEENFSASKYTVSPARSSATHFVCDAAAPAVYVIHRQQPPDGSCEKNSAVGARRDRDAVTDRRGDGGGVSEKSRMRSENAIDPAESKSLRSLMLRRREVDQLPPLASTRGAGPSRRAAKKGSLSLDSASLSPSPVASLPSPSPQESIPSLPLRVSSPIAKKSSRWSLGLDFLHSKRASSPNGQHVGGEESMVNANNYRDAAVGSHSCSEAPESCRLSSSSCSSVAIAGGPEFGPEFENPVRYGDEEAGQPAKANYKKSRSAPVSPSGSPSRAAAPLSGGTRHPTHPSTPRSNAPMSPHAEHYEQQRARAQHLRRRTFLPYRRNILGSCFFPPPSPVTSC